MPSINIKGLKKDDVLAALYNRANPLGLGKPHFRSHRMTRDEASEIISTGQKYFDYVHGRVLKIALDCDEILTTLYDRDNGKGAALEALEPLFKKIEN